MLNNKRIVVTGGAGFIGSNLVHTLAKENEVVVIDDLSTGHKANIQDLLDTDSIQFIKGSITDRSFLQHLFKDVDYVFHEAAIPSVPRSVKDPNRSHEANATGTLNVLLAAKDNMVTKVIYASSSSVYGDTPTLPKREDMPPNPLSPYAVSKLTGEYYCQVFTQVYTLQTICLRYFNVYGPHQDPRGEYAAVIPRFITTILNGFSPHIYDDGTQTRDFTFVDDVVQVNIHAAEQKAVGVFNVAGGKQISINDLAKRIIDMVGKDLELIYDTARPGDIKHSLADISKMKQTLKYTPQIDIKKGLEETVRWFQQHKL